MTRMIQATRIHPARIHYQCRRCGITLTYERHSRYNDVCTDCTEYIPTTRKHAS